MRRRQITIEGGRYLIFYSFEDERGLDAARSSGAATTLSDATAATRADALGEARDDAGDDRPSRGNARASSSVEPSAEGVRRV